MQEAKTLTELLERLDKTITADKDFTARALGLLLLGQRFDRDVFKESNRDPTDLILNDPSLKMPAL